MLVLRRIAGFGVRPTWMPGGRDIAFAGPEMQTLYLVALSRPPSAEEKQIAVEYLKGGALQERTEDLLYVLINSLEFLFS